MGTAAPHLKAACPLHSPATKLWPQHWPQEMGVPLRHAHPAQESQTGFPAALFGGSQENEAAGVHTQRLSRHSNLGRPGQEPGQPF